MNTNFNQPMEATTDSKQKENLNKTNTAGGMNFGLTSSLNVKKPQTKNFLQMNKQKVAAMSINRQPNASAERSISTSQFRMVKANKMALSQSQMVTAGDLNVSRPGSKRRSKSPLGSQQCVQ